MQDFRELKVWLKAHQLTVAAYQGTRRVRRRAFPGLVPQLLRSAASIPTNIAEGCGHSRPGEMARFLQIAVASAFELDYHILLAADLGILDAGVAGDLETRVREVKRMLASLIRVVKARSGSGDESQAADRPGRGRTTR